MLDFPRRQQAWAPDSHQPLPVQSWSQEGGQALVITGHTQEWIPTPASACPGAADLGGQGQAPTCLPVPKDLSSWAPCVGRAMEQGADSSQTRSAESSPSFSWGLGNRASPLFLSHSQGPEPKPQPDLCTSWVFSCFSLLFRSPLVRLSFSSSVTFFSRKLTYNRGQRWGRIKPLRPQH